MAENSSYNFKWSYDSINIKRPKVNREFFIYGILQDKEMLLG